MNIVETRLVVRSPYPPIHLLSNGRLGYHLRGSVLMTFFFLLFCSFKKTTMSYPGDHVSDLEDYWRLENEESLCLVLSTHTFLLSWIDECMYVHNSTYLQLPSAKVSGTDVGCMCVR
jgi:hypothetical protein